jgi:hypothetical protein
MQPAGDLGEHPLNLAEAVEDVVPRPAGVDEPGHVLVLELFDGAVEGMRPVGDAAEIRTDVLVGQTLVEVLGVTGLDLGLLVLLGLLLGLALLGVLDLLLLLVGVVVMVVLGLVVVVVVRVVVVAGVVALLVIVVDLLAVVLNVVLVSVLLLLGLLLPAAKWLVHFVISLMGL